MMNNREELIAVLEEQVSNRNIIKHMLATEACMKFLARRLKSQISNVENEEVNENEWAFAGLIHDGDYRSDVPLSQQGVKIIEVLRNKGIEVSDSVAHAVAAHNWDNTGVEPKSLMDWALYCCDSLTGLIVATCLVLPNKKLSEVTAERVINRFNEPKFAAGTRREQIKMCEEKLKIGLREFVEICLKAMQEIASDLGL